MSNSATTSRGRSRLPSATAARPAKRPCASARDPCSMTSATFRPQDLDRNRRAVGQRRRSEPAQPTRSPPASRSNAPNTSSSGLPNARDDRRRDLRREWRNAILKQREFVGDIGRQQVAPCRQHLAELDEDRTEVLERTAQAHAARQGEVAPEQHGSNERPQRTHARVPERQVVQTVPQRNDEDPEKPTKAHAEL